ncbi:ATP-binding protein [Microbacterium panaciterrae]|uniref:ATP-binding protein n=1 Tax=Microbacterium panaciterrae TaxID=985759 RepID=A0ABP8P1B1_9MICO
MADDLLQVTVARLRRQGTDDALVEVKSSAKSLTTDIWDTVSAFANTAGGTIILGLSEEAGFLPVEQFALDRVRDQFVEGIGDGGGSGVRLTNPPSYALRRDIIDDGEVLVIVITENPVGLKPCFVTAKGLPSGAFRRVDDKNIRLSPAEVFEMQHALTPSKADGEPVPDADESDLDPEIIEALLTRMASSKALYGTSTRREKLSRLNIVDKQGRIRLAGLLTAGVYPQQFLPRLLIDVAVHLGREKSLPGVATRFIDRRECVGPVADSIDEAINVVLRNLRTYSIVEGAGRSEVPEIPTEVLREAIANAVLHREYAAVFTGQPVTVDVFSDRIEITNPGGLWGGKTLENLDDGTSRCRNLTLMPLMQQIAVRGAGRFTVEGQGGGVRMMNSEMEAHALQRPHYVATPDQVRVTLWRHGAEIPEHREWLRGLVDRDLDAREDTALLLARREGEVSVAGLRDALRIDSDEARETLRALRREGVLRMTHDETFVLAEGAPLPASRDFEIFRVLSKTDPRTIHEIAEASGRAVGALRKVLRGLVSDGWIIATASPTSKNRRYLLAMDDDAPERA